LRRMRFFACGVFAIMLKPLNDKNSGESNAHAVKTGSLAMKPVTVNHWPT